MVATILVAFITSLATGIITFLLQERRLRAELRTEFMAEEVAKRLLNSPNWNKRSFGEIKKRLGGFEDEELRKILVRAGAVRFMGKDDIELWGLIERNEADL